MEFFKFLYRPFALLAILMASVTWVNSQTYTTNSATTLVTQGCYELVNGANLRGSVWNNTKIDLNNPFDFTFNVTMDNPVNPSSPAGDGMAFVLQTTGLSALSNAGAGLGYAQPPGGIYGPITPSFAVELDIWGNGGGVIDMAGGVHHIACHINGSITTVAIGPVAARPGNFPCDDGVCRPLRIKWVPAGDSIYVWYDNVPRIATTYNIKGLFPTTQVYWGLTGSSGSVGPGVITACWDFANAGPDPEICSDSLLVLNGSGGTTYSWTDLNNNVPTWLSGANTANPTVTNPPAGNSTLQVTVTNSYGCVDQDQVVIESDPAIPTANAGPDSTFCSTSLINLFGNNPNPGTGQWSMLGGSISPTVSQPFNWLSPVTGWGGGPFPATFAVQWKISSNTPWNNCPTTYDTVNITIVQAPSADAGPNNDSLCSGETLTLNGSGVGANQYLWWPSTGVVNPNSAVTDLSISNTSAPANYFTASYYHLTVTDTVTGCSAVDSIRIWVADPPSYVFAAGRDTLFCRKDTMTITIDSIDFWYDQIFWNPTAGLINYGGAGQSYAASPDTTTTYVITTSNSKWGCEYHDSVTITLSNVGLQGLEDQKICRGDTVRISVLADSAANTIMWTSNPGSWIATENNASTLVSPPATTEYTVMVMDTTGLCDPGQGSLTVYVQELTLTLSGTPLNTVLFPGEIVINPGQTATLSSTLGTTSTSTFTYSWAGSPTITCATCPETEVTPVATAWNAGDGSVFPYTLTVTDDSSNCEVEETINVRFDIFEAPNVFTPNGDGFNDFLYVNYHGPMEYKASIFDRWGRRLFQTENKTVNWDGNDMSGKPANEGVYYLVIEIENNPNISPDLWIPEGKKNEGRNRVYAVTLLR
ncbi:MAG: gliding motility-associated C-terminal domain-containing protein [Bacteroidia bacterium]|nr:gliding motility-associated C-terminal domain-containing protein [Bacteroidia bacterium]